jgi:diadenosine tetraphosphate (Ap4A) HIT family hydrolase
MTKRTWPANWDDLTSGQGCEMCAMQGKHDNGFGVVVFEGTHADVVLQRVRPTAGYCVAIWKHGHACELSDLDDEQLAGYWQDNVRAVRALVEVYTPAKVNYQVLGNGVPHIHTHIILRFLDDPAPGRPLPMIQETYEQLSEQAFQEELASVRAVLQRQA